MAPEPMPRTRMLHPDQNHARNKHPSSQQPCEIYRLLLQTQQPEMIEHDRSNHLADDNQGEHCRRAKTRHHDNRNADEDGAEEAARP